MIRALSSGGFALVLALGSFAQSAKSITIDWSALSWSPGSISNSYDIDPSSAGNDITITIGGDLNTLTDSNGNGTGVATPAIDSLLDGGQSPVHPSLDIAANLHTNDRLTITVTFSPNYLQGVRDVSFTLFDVDQQTNDDEIHNVYAIGVTTGSPIAGTVTSLGPSITLS
jgi:hypothetical protein